jgi:hypothetical protein
VVPCHTISQKCETVARCMTAGECRSGDPVLQGLSVTPWGAAELRCYRQGGARTETGRSTVPDRTCAFRLPRSCNRIGFYMMHYCKLKWEANFIKNCTHYHRHPTSSAQSPSVPAPLRSHLPSLSSPAAPSHPPPPSPSAASPPPKPTYRAVPGGSDNPAVACRGYNTCMPRGRPSWIDT